MANEVETVGELIKALSEFPPDMRVVAMWDSTYWGIRVADAALVAIDHDDNSFTAVVLDVE